MAENRAGDIAIPQNRLVGYYITYGDAVCLPCYLYVRLSEITVEGGDAIPIFVDSEADAPTHCVKCELLLPHSLTTDGMKYVKAAVEDYERYGTHSRPEILAAWREAYL